MIVSMTESCCPEAWWTSLCQEDRPSLVMLAVVPATLSLGLLSCRQVELGHLDQIRAIFALAPLSYIPSQIPLKELPSFFFLCC